jgi:hypothetical protein
MSLFFNILELTFTVLSNENLAEKRKSSHNSSNDRPMETGAIQPNPVLTRFPDPTLNGESELTILTEPRYNAQIVIADNNNFLGFIQQSLRAIGAGFVKVMCKSFIHTIDPNRRKTYPYSKSKSDASGPRLPAWWPPDLRFKEPDHLVQDECERLISFMLTWCLGHPQSHMKRGIKTLWSDMWRFGKFKKGADAKGTEEQNKKFFMLQQMERVTLQREAFLKDDIGAQTKLSFSR